jgi:hypothetical protein
MPSLPAHNPTLVLSQPQPPSNIPAYNVALDGLGLASIGIECLSEHARVEETIYCVKKKDQPMRLYGKASSV